MSEELQPEPRVGVFEKTKQPSSADHIMAKLPGTYYRLTEVAEILGLSVRTLRRLIPKGHTKAPSKQITVGGMKMYLYTPEDVQEIRDYYRIENREDEKD